MGLFTWDEVPSTGLKKQSHGCAVLVCAVSAAALGQTDKQHTGLKVAFVTNTSGAPSSAVVKQLNEFGIPTQPGQVVTALSATAQHVAERKLSPLLLVSDAARSQFDRETSVHSSDKKSAASLAVEPNAVVLGLAPEQFSYDSLTRAFSVLEAGGKLVAANKSRYFRRSKGNMIGVGAFVAALEFASGQEAVVCGKPSPEFFRAGIAALGGSLSPESVVMIGDDVRDDVAGAMALGMKGILVRTGKYRDGDEFRFGVQPSACLGGLQEAASWILERSKQRPKL